MLPAMRDFIGKMRALCAATGDAAERFERARPYLKDLLADPELKRRAASWPSRNDPAKGHYENLLFYEDPDYGFVLNALIKEPGEATPVHDHGRVWTVYGVLEGGETVHRYRRVGGADDLEMVGDHEVSPGYIDFVPPGEIHAEYNGPKRTVGIILRSANVGTNPQTWYDLETGGRLERFGPRQVPYALD
ncbi:MAG: hypothetical protein OXI22_11825 [Defluviicoccus sp.]|nr:hypothetical protein [Defluviicoccus sp.]MDE0384564.1 hypothetical protein [Defluviicoccus sp.]